MGIENEPCIKCRECVKDCPAHLFFSPPTPAGEKRKVIFKDPYNRCIKCGHCIAICPMNAILYEDAEQAFEFEEAKDPSLIVNFETLSKILRSRRSTRRYKPDSVPKEEILAVLESTRYAPSAGNAQSWEYIVLTDLKKIDKVRKAAIKMMKLLRKVVNFRKLLSLFVSSNVKEFLNDPATKIGLDDFFKRIKEGQDPIFFKAPVVIITYAPKSSRFSSADAGIALTYGMLAAQTRGLGSC